MQRVRRKPKKEIRSILCSSDLTTSSRHRKRNTPHTRLAERSKSHQQRAAATATSTANTLPPNRTAILSPSLFPVLPLPWLKPPGGRVGDDGSGLWVLLPPSEPGREPEPRGLGLLPPPAAPMPLWPGMEAGVLVGPAALELPLGAPMFGSSPVACRLLRITILS